MPEREPGQKPDIDLAMLAEGIEKEVYPQETKEQYFPDPVRAKEYLNTFREYFGNLESLRGQRYLNVGAGKGSMLETVVKRLGVEVVSLDYDYRLLQTVRGKGVPAIGGDALTLPILDGALDGVISSNLINAEPPGIRRVLPEEKLVSMVFREVHRVLKPEGYFIQSHFGEGVPPFDELRELLRIGFRNIRVIEDSQMGEDRRRGRWNPFEQHRLAFIAQKPKPEDLRPMDLEAMEAAVARALKIKWPPSGKKARRPHYGDFSPIT